MAGLAFLLAIVLVLATGFAFVAREAYGAGQSWAYKVCTTAPYFCDHPAWVAIAAGITVVFYFLLRSGEA